MKKRNKRFERELSEVYNNRQMLQPICSNWRKSWRRMVELTLQELYDFGNFHNAICVKSAYNGKILCKQFNPKKHTKIAEREVSSIWPEIQLLGRKQDRHQMARAILCCYVNGREEFEKERRIKRNENT